MKKTNIIHLVIAVLFIFISIPLTAGSWDWTRPYKMPEKNVNTLIVIKNTTTARLMGDLIQAETKQPILLIPVDSDDKIFFLPAKDQTMPIEYDDLTDFIKYLNPGKIVVIGDKQDFIPEKYLEAIDPSQTVISITNKDWNKIAATATRILNLTYLNRRFGKYMKKLESGELYRPENPPLEANRTAAKTDEQPIIVVDETKINDSIVTDDTKTGDTTEAPVIKEPEIKSEPKLIDETKVVPK